MNSSGPIRWLAILELYPEIRINPAIRLRAWYQIGRFETPGPLVATYGLYRNSSNPDAWNPISTGEWTEWWATAQTPWRLVVVGKGPLAFDTPYKWVKQIPSYIGGTRQGMAISWLARIKDKGGIRNQFHHVIDIVPMLLEVTGIPAPVMVDGVAQKPIEGVSMAYTFDKANANAPSTHRTQYFEMMGVRGLYHDGWMLSTDPDPPTLETAGKGHPRSCQRLSVGALTTSARTGRSSTTCRVQYRPS